MGKIAHSIILSDAAPKVRRLHALGVVSAVADTIHSIRYVILLSCRVTIQYPYPPWMPRWATAPDIVHGRRGCHGGGPWVLHRPMALPSI